LIIGYNAGDLIIAFSELRERLEQLRAHLSDADLGDDIATSQSPTA